MIGKSVVDIEDYTSCIEVISASPLIDEESKEKLIKLFNTRLANDGDDDLGKDSSTQSQTCKYPENFLTQELISKWEREDADWAYMCGALVDVWHTKMGLKYADVDTRKRATALMVMYSGQSLTPREIKDNVYDELAKCLSLIHI